MKQLVQNYRSGVLAVEEVSPPQLRAGGVLVRNHYSLVSAGTERGMVEFARKSLVGKALARPDLVRKVLDKARTEGVIGAVEKAFHRLDETVALGYSSAGVVTAVAGDVTGLAVGDRVACAGLGYASHAEAVFVPANLCVRVPDGMDLAQAAYVTLGAIALEGVRVADLRLGETAVVIGLGLVGLLTVQLLRVSGCRVLGIDMDERKVELAQRLGADVGVVRGDEGLAAQVERFTGGQGADGVLVTAATASSDPLELAAEVARDRAAVTIVGITGMSVPRKAFYEKALQLRMSRSYGPGRYDRRYEEKGNDYPIGYVRWTERRNMEAFLRLAAEGKVDVGALTTHTYDIQSALDAYALVEGRRAEPYIGILLRYAPDAAVPGRVPLGTAVPEATPPGAVRVGVIGAGAFATGVLLPALARTAAVPAGIASLGGTSARRAGERFGFAYCASDAGELLADDAVNAVVIASRPASHADLVLQALARGKHVFVEKPLAVDMEQLRGVWAAHRSAREPRVVMVGFNRRYSPFGRRLRDFFHQHAQPLTMTYRVNAGALERSSWQLDPEQGGGRLIGEVGHFVDLMGFVAGEEPTRVGAVSAGGENVVLTITFSGGSVGSVVYVASGAPAFSKERLEVFADGAVGVLDDFRRLELIRRGRRRRASSILKQDKGHREEMRRFVSAVAGRDGAAPPFEASVLATLVTLQAAEAIRSGQSQPVGIELLG